MSVRVITLAGDADTEAAITSRLSDTDIDVYMRCMDRVGVLAALRVGALNAVVAVGAPSWLDRELVTEIRAAGVGFIGMAGDPFEAEHLLDLGALLLPTEADAGQIAAACSAAVAEPEEKSTERSRRGHITAVWGPKGAPGRTSVAIETACALARRYPATALVDADMYGGDILQLLGIQEELPTLVWATRMAVKEELDEGQIAEGLRRVGRNGPVLVPGISRAELWPEVTATGWRVLIQVLQRHFDHLVVDTGFCLEPVESGLPTGDGRNDIARAAISASDRVVAVLRASPTGLRHFLWAYDQLTDLVDPDRILVVMNDVDVSREPELHDLLLRRTGRRASVCIGRCDRELQRAKDRGRPVHEIAPRSEFVEAARSIVRIVGGGVEHRGVFARLAGKR